jgi:hypothetical protein
MSHAIQRLSDIVDSGIKYGGIKAMEYLTVLQQQNKGIHKRYEEAYGRLRRHIRS